MEKHKAPAQLPTNEPSLELQVFKKSIGGTLGEAIGPVVVFPLYSGYILKMRCLLGPRELSIVFQHRGEGCCSLQEHLL